MDYADRLYLSHPGDDDRSTDARMVPLLRRRYCRGFLDTHRVYHGNLKYDAGTECLDGMASFLYTMGFALG